jgi:NitT/TauT family transport system ATP-binding protein
MIRLSGISKSFRRSGGSAHILDRVTFDVPEGRTTTLFGPNGCGKSTLMNIISGIETPDEGAVEGGGELAGAIGYVFQDYRRSLLPWHTVRENILFPLWLRGVSARERESRLERLFGETGVRLEPGQRVTTLSGGQAQLVSVLRALIINPRLLILDEPFAALDYERTILLRETLTTIADRLSLTVLCISHDLDEALAIGHRVVFLSRPPTRVVEVLPVDLPFPRGLEVLAHPEFLDLKRRAVSIFGRCLGRDGV